ncbi:MAG: hypothetical protein KDB27_35330, partial [Planctomycetales bacterium]|nr:hypothetical protein [Planctomycetales bacterium]
MRFTFFSILLLVISVTSLETRALAQAPNAWNAYMRASNAHYAQQYAACIKKWREETGDYTSSDSQIMQKI